MKFMLMLNLLVMVTAIGLVIIAVAVHSSPASPLLLSFALGLWIGLVGAWIGWAYRESCR